MLKSRVDSSTPHQGRRLMGACLRSPLASIRSLPTADRTHGSSGSARPQSPLVRVSRGAVVIKGNIKATRADGPHADPTGSSSTGPMDLRLGGTNISSRFFDISGRYPSQTQAWT